MQQYQNPILYADYSDPDVIRVGEDYYMVSSSFSRFSISQCLQLMEKLRTKLA